MSQHWWLIRETGDRSLANPGGQSNTEKSGNVYFRPFYKLSNILSLVYTGLCDAEGFKNPTPSAPLTRRRDNDTHEINVYLHNV